MKNIVKLLLFFCFFYINESNAQNNDLYLVKLKSGLTIKCELIKVVPDSFVIIRQYGLESKVNMSDVVNITYSESLFQTKTFNGKVKKIKHSLPDSGWSFGIQPGFTIGTDGWDVTSSFTMRGSFLNSNGKNSMYGFNIGFDPYSYYNTVLGISSVEGRQYISKRNATRTFISGTLGYGWNLSSPRTGIDGGLLWSLGIGNSYRLNNGNIFSYQFGFKTQNFISEDRIWGRIDPIIQHISTKRFEFKVEWRY